MKMTYYTFLIHVIKINFFYKYKNYCIHHFQPFDTCDVPHLIQSENLIHVIVPSARE